MGDRQPSDAEVIERCLRGEVEPFSLLVERYRDRVYNLALRLLERTDDALDVSQETFIRAYGALSGFDAERPLAPWLFRIATNLCIGVLRKRRPEVSFETLEENELAAPGGAYPGRREGDPELSALRVVRDEEIRNAVRRLPEPYRTVVVLRYHDELTHEEIAAVLEIPIGTVKTHLHRARMRLRKMLAEE